MSQLSEEHSRPDSSPDKPKSPPTPPLQETYVTQSLEDILEDLKKQVNNLLPPKSSRREIVQTRDFIRSIRQDDILRLANAINQLSNDDILRKVEDIEQVALRLDKDQQREFNNGEAMNVIRR